MASPWSMCVVFLLTAVQEAGSQKWKDDPKDGLVIHKCATQNVTFSWEIEPEEEVLVAISWTQLKGEMKTNIADYYDGKFNAKKANLEQVGLAGIKLSNLSMEDSATYIVNVKLKSVPLMTRSVSLSLSEPPQMLTVQGFHIKLSTAKEMTPSTDAQSSAYRQLWCGPFAYLGKPAISVVWTHPDQRQEEVSYFEDNYFKLNLTAMHEGGLYFCEINNSSPAFQCLQSDSPLRKSASINIVAPELETVQAAAPGLSGGEVAGIAISVVAILLIVIIVAAFIVVKSKGGKYYKPRKSEEELPEGASDPLSKQDI